MGSFGKVMPVQLEPSRKKLTTLETQRVMGVWDDSIKRVELLTALPHVLDNISDFSIVLGRELVDELTKHKEYKEEYDSLSAKLDHLTGRDLDEEVTQEELIEAEDFWTRPRSNKTTSAKNQSSADEQGSEEEIQSQRLEIEARLNEILPHLQYSSRCVLRSFRKNPAAIAELTTVARSIDRSNSSRRLMHKMNDIKDMMMLRLMTTPSEKATKLAYLHDMSTKEKAHSVIIRKLENELRLLTEEKEVDMKAKNEVIRRLQVDIHHIEKFSEENIKKIKSESEKQQQSDEKNSEGRSHKLEQERTQLRVQLDGLVLEHRESESNLRTRKYKLETEVENWLQKYDTDIGERQEEYEEIDGAYTEEKKQLYELEERFKTLEEEYLQIQEERRIARERREAAEKELQHMVMAATCIQSFWRSFKVRKVMRGKKKKGGKGGKKKK